MSDGILQGLDPQAIAEHFGEVDTEYTWTAEPLPVPVCLQVASCNGAAILALEKRIAEMERKRDAAQQSRARLVGLVRFKNLEIKVLASDVKDLDTGNKELITELDAATKRAEQAEADACELANLVLMIGDVTDAGDLELVNKYTGRN